MDFKKYKKSQVIILTLVGATVLLLLSWLCTIAALNPDSMNVLRDGEVVLAFSCLAYLLLGGLYGYLVSSIVFLIIFVITLINNGTVAFKMVIYLVAMLCFALFGQYRWFATFLKTAISSLLSLFMISAT